MTSTAVSESITRRSASNLALAFIMLPADRRRDMAVLYAFCREVDDVADEEAHPVEERRQQLARWREDVRKACDGGQPEFPVNQELQPVIQRRRLPFALFDELIQGCEMDLDTDRYEDFAALRVYCHRVASVVGLLSIEIFGYRDPGCRDYAIALGQALQLTNILRDVGNDARRGRIYLPREALRRHGVVEADILAQRPSDGFRALAAEVAIQAREHYREAREQLPKGDRRAMVAAELMGAVYWRLLLRIEQTGFAVLGPDPVRLSRPRKLSLILWFWLRHRFGATRPAYGSP